MNLFYKLLIGGGLAALLACAPEPVKLPPAPLGEYDALQNLAAAFEKQTERMDQSPNIQVPEFKKAFVESVFQAAGYDYVATLHSITPSTFDPADQLHRDLAELVLYPLKGFAPEEAEKIYSPEDVERIKQLTTWLR